MGKKNKKKLGTVYLVGGGPGDPGLFTLRGAEVLKNADVIVYDWLVNPTILELASQAEKIYVGKNTHVLSRKQQVTSCKLGYVQQKDTNQLLVKLAQEGKNIVRLKGGDPFIFGRGGEEASLLRAKGIPFEIVPGISAGYAVPAYAGIPVTDRRFASQVTFVTGHEDPSKPESSVDWKHLAKNKGTIVSFMGVKKLPDVTKILRENGMPAQTKVSVIEWGTLPKQRVAEGTLATIAAKVRAQKIQSPAITVIGEVNRFRKELRWFENKSLFGKRILVTRARAQASGLRKLLEDRGAQVMEFPAIHILPPEDCEPLDEALESLDHIHWIVFTSVNGVDGVFDRLKFLEKDARAFYPLKIAAIGDATEQRLLEKGLKADLVPDRFTTEAMLEKFRTDKEISGCHFLLPRTDIAPDILRKGLEEMGAVVKEVVAYRTVPAVEDQTQLREWLKQDELDYILFTSSSTVRNFFEAVPKEIRRQIKARFISIGPVTSETLRSYGFKPFREAKEHTVPGLIETLEGIQSK